MEKYAGIDIAKRTHWMCVTDAEGRFLMEPRPYDNDAEACSAWSQTSTFTAGI